MLYRHSDFEFSTKNSKTFFKMVRNLQNGKKSEIDTDIWYICYLIFNLVPETPDIENL